MEVGECERAGEIPVHLSLELWKIKWRDGGGVSGWMTRARASEGSSKRGGARAGAPERAACSLAR
jgi:hypothetical protein